MTVKPFFQFMPQHDLADCFVVISLNLEIGYFTVSLCRADLVMPQQILDNNQICIGIEKLRGHGMTKLMAAYF